MEGPIAADPQNGYGRRHQGGVVTHYPAFGAFMVQAKRVVRAFTLAAFCIVMSGQSVAQVTAPGTIVRNTGVVSFDGGAGVRVVSSNEVTLTVAPSPSRATIDLARFAVNSATTETAGPTQCRASAGFVALPPPAPLGTGAIDPLQPVPLANTGVAHAGDPVFVRVTDADQNRDAIVVETIDVRIEARDTGDAEVLRLAETGPNTGVFVGYIATRAAAAAADCALEVARDSQLFVTYVDPTDPTDVARADALVDPFGLVFDSQTGAAIDGARVRLIDLATGAPAAVFGDDGVSRYPSEMVTGQRVTDSGGTQYDLPAGVYRFPLVAPGQYRLEITPPNNYNFPSVSQIVDLQALPGGPFRLNDGSYGRTFAVPGPPAVAVDVPLDPAGTNLLLRKVASATNASVGDFVQYTLTLENTSARGAFASLETRDVLPAGARYRRGSLRINDLPAADPAIAADGRTMTIRTGRLEAGARIAIRYVVEMTVGVRGREAVNIAQAVAAGGTRSNEARALVRMNGELFSDKGFIVGRVYEGECLARTVPERESPAPGVPGLRVYLEDGRYGVTDDDGKFHFEGLEAGTHVVQIDLDTLPEHLELLACEASSEHAGRRYSQFVDLRAGALWRADFVVRQRQPPSGDLQFDFRSSVHDAQRTTHSGDVRVGGVATGNTRVLVLLPEGLDYEPGSATIDDALVADGAAGSEGVGGPRVSLADRMLTIRLNELSPGESRRIAFRTRTSAAAGGDLPVKALVAFDTAAKSNQRTAPITAEFRRGASRYLQQRFTFTPRFDVAKTDLLPPDERALRELVAAWRDARNVRMRVVGHADHSPIVGKLRDIFPDNYALSEARARVVADYLAQALNLPADRVKTAGYGSDDPIAPGRDAASLAQNRRVEIYLDGERFDGDAPLEIAGGGSGLVSMATQGALIRGPRSAALVRPRDATLNMPTAPAAMNSEATPDIETLAPNLAWLLPADGALPPISSIKVAVQHAPQQLVALSVNGTVVSRLNFDGVSLNRARTVAISRWRGVDLADGDNAVVAVVTNGDGTEAARLERIVHYGGGPVRAVIDRNRSTLIADGKTRPVIALQMFDAYGKPARRGTLASFRVEPPYRSWWEVEALNDNPILSNGPREPTVTVGDDGIALLELEPTTQTGNVSFRVRFNERRDEQLRAWLAPAPRDFVLVGIAEGTAAYRTISGNAEAASAADRDDGFEGQGRVAFFAKGRIKGDFLLTLAYDSARDKDMARERLRGVIAPDQYYLLYGDATEQRFEAASQRKLYVKLERRQFVAMFGDYDTGFTVTELTRYSRSLNGLKADFAGDRFQASAFAARTDTGFVRDELAGDGTSGLYRLSRAPIVIGSDKLRIEVRDRFRTEQVLQTRELAPFIEYDLDYDRGTLFFKEPVPVRDANFNPVFIIADYEVRTNGDEETSAGVRVASKLANDKLEIGVSMLHDGARAGDSQIGGADLKWHLAPATELRAEVARSESDDPLRADAATAYLAEIEHVTDKLDARAYVREEESGFGVGQQFASESGTRKAGVDARWRFAQEWQLQSQVERQEVLATDAERMLTSAELRYQDNERTAGVGVRRVADSQPGEADRDSSQAFVSGSVAVLDGRVTLRGSHDFTLASDDASTDYPARSLIGVDYRVTTDTTVFAEYEHAEGRDLESDMTRVGVRARPWERAQIVTSVTEAASEFGPRTFANFGLTQSWQVNERWGVDFGIDQSNTLRGPNLEPFNPMAPLASGTVTEDYFASFVGAQYRQALWQFTSRLEHRNADSEDRWSVTTGWYREPVRGHALSLSLQAFDTDGLLADASEATARFAWAYRPIDSTWIVFDRLELKFDERDDGFSATESRRLVNNLHANRQWGERTQLGLQFGARYAVNTFDGERYDGYTDLLGFDARRQVSRRFDIGLQGAALHSWESDVAEYSAGLDVGVTIMNNVWISLGYNFVGFRDEDFSASRYTDRGPFLRVRVKADQDTFRNLRLDSLRPSR
jgi:uncharacterized repeat protein (TIGR01451 family)